MNFDFDYLVIGGGSGGLASAKLAQELGKKVCVVDFVKPSPQGTKWGLGGTCVNVGCIPKKLFHTAGIYGDIVEKSKYYGWKLPNFDNEEFAKTKQKYHDWEELKTNVWGHIASLNFKYVSDLNVREVEYKNAYAMFDTDEHTLKLTDAEGKEEKVTAQYVTLAMGGRPRYPNIPGAKEYAITSDDIFYLEKDPKKTLVVGASYIALETAGFLNGIGREAVVMVREKVLRGFDEGCAGKIKSDLEERGVRFMIPCSPTKIVKTEAGRLSVEFVDNQTNETHTEEFDTVMMATGRDPCTRGLGLEKVGIKLDPRSGKVLVNDEERTSVDTVFAIGDIIEHQELTPVAIATGRLLVKRLFGDSSAKMDYTNVPTTVFTPLEYGSIGMTQEAAVEKYGDEVDVFEANGNILENEIAFTERQSYFKIIVRKSDDVIIGFHYLGPNAGEITQYFALAMKCGATKAKLDQTVGIHPTIAELATTLYQLKKKDTGC